MPFPVAAAIMGGTSLIGGLFNNAQQRKTARQNTDKTIAHQTRLAEYAYDRDLEMWNRQNEYNNPKAQMSRLKSAGLNPHLIYGSGSVTGNTGSQMPKYNAPKPEYNYLPAQLQIPEVIGQYQNLAIKQAQYDNIKAQNAQINAQTGLLMNKTDIAHSDAQFKKSDLWNRMRKAKAQTTTEVNKHQLQGLEAQNRSEQLRWLRAGMRPGDNIWLRMGMQMLPQLGVSKKWLQNIFSPSQLSLIYGQKIRKR